MRDAVCDQPAAPTRSRRQGDPGRARPDGPMLVCLVRRPRTLPPHQPPDCRAWPATWRLAVLAIVGSAILIATAAPGGRTSGPIHRWLFPANGTSSVRPMPGNRDAVVLGYDVHGSHGTGPTGCGSCRASCWA